MDQLIEFVQPFLIPLGTLLGAIVGYLGAKSAQNLPWLKDSREKYAFLVQYEEAVSMAIQLMEIDRKMISEIKKTEDPEVLESYTNMWATGNRDFIDFIIDNIERYPLIPKRTIGKAHRLRKLFQELDLMTRAYIGTLQNDIEKDEGDYLHPEYVLNKALSKYEVMYPLAKEIKAEIEGHVHRLVRSF